MEYKTNYNAVRTANIIYGLVLILHNISAVSGLELKVGSLFTVDRCCSFLSYENKASAMTIAIEQLHADGVLDNRTVSFKFLLGDCYSESSTVGTTIRFIRDDDVDVIFGSAKSSLTLAVAHITTHYKLPHITWLSNSMVFANKTLFETLVRTIGPISVVGEMAVTMFKEFGWTKAGIVNSGEELSTYIASGLKETFAQYNLTFTQTVSFHESLILTDDVIDGFLMRVKQTSRIIFICQSFDVRPFMVRACYCGMCDGRFIFIHIWPGSPPEQPWKRSDGHDHVAKQAYKFLLQVAVATYKGESGRQRRDNLLNNVITKMTEPPWNIDTEKYDIKPYSYGTENLYEAMYLYGLWVNHSIETGVNHRDGHAWLEFAKGQSFAGAGGPCDISSNGDKIPYFWIFQYIGDDTTLALVAESENKNKELAYVQSFQWYTDSGLPPKDEPDCGFFDELCPTILPQDNTVVVIISCLAAFVILTGCLVIGYLIRKRSLEKDLLQRIWKIELCDLEVTKPTQRLGSQISHFKSHSELSMLTENTHGDTNLDGDALSCFKFTNRLTGSAKVANYAGKIVAIKTIPKHTVLTTDELQDLKTMREFVHDNINPFIGACLDTSSACMLFVYCPKGSLEDILENDEIQLDTNFKTSLAIDLVQGMLYLHHSRLGSHGRLKSCNCLVDNRWMVKVTDYGVARFLKHSDTINNPNDNATYKSLLWTAPEFLSDLSRCPKGTKEGDIYSFGIILHEIFYRLGPFGGNGNLTTKEIITKVEKREAGRLCRPGIVPDQDGVSDVVIKLMKMCWADNENERPTFSIVRMYVKKQIQHGHNVNIVDLILQRLEKYANNLEELVGQRTQQLMLEKQKSDRLLYRMLPRLCADKLKAGIPVEPEIFESATVFFSDIVGFTTISSMITPMEVVDLLNDLYICFDDIISVYDAYKVETIGDAYLVVSGIPNRNGNIHAGIIASMSLDILHKVGKFKIKRLPEVEIKVRIGNHTGSVCAGVVGLSMPRYCIFGDTVNTASRMESNGLAQKIHISEVTQGALRELGGYDTELRGDMEIKGKGVMKTYWLLRKREQTCNNELHFTSDNFLPLPPCN